MDRKKAADLAYAEGYRLGAASRDAEVTKWIERVNSWTRDCERLADERDQLHAQIKQKDAEVAELVAALEELETLRQFVKELQQ